MTTAPRWALGALATAPLAVAAPTAVQVGWLIVFVAALVDGWAAAR